MCMRKLNIHLFSPSGRSYNVQCMYMWRRCAYTEGTKGLMYSTYTCTCTCWEEGSRGVTDLYTVPGLPLTYKGVFKGEGLEMMLRIFYLYTCIYIFLHMMYRFSGIHYRIGVGVQVGWGGSTVLTSQYAQSRCVC